MIMVRSPMRLLALPTLVMAAMMMSTVESKVHCFGR